MDAKVVNPWQRAETEFKHPNLKKWVGDNRGKILAAALTIGKAWIVAKRPSPSSTLCKMGGFEQWREVIGGMLEYAGGKDFLKNMDLMYAESDADTPQWELFLEIWNKIFNKNGCAAVTVKEVQQQLTMERETAIFDRSCCLYDCLPDHVADAFNGKKDFGRVLGKSLARIKGRVFKNNLKVEKSDVEHQAVTWKVCRIE